MGPLQSLSFLLECSSTDTHLAHSSLSQVFTRVGHDHPFTAAGTPSWNSITSPFPGHNYCPPQLSPLSNSTLTLLILLVISLSSPLNKLHKSRRFGLSWFWLCSQNLEQCLEHHRWTTYLLFVEWVSGRKQSGTFTLKYMKLFLQIKSGQISGTSCSSFSLIRCNPCLAQRTYYVGGHLPHITFALCAPIQKLKILCNPWVTNFLFKWTFVFLILWSMEQPSSR